MKEDVTEVKFADKHTLKICAYKDFLILTYSETPKAKSVGIGMLLNNFNNKDVLLSNDALNLIKASLIHDSNKSELSTDTGLIIHNKTKIFWASYNNMIIKIKDATIYDIPTHTIIENDVDEKIKTQLNTIK